MNKKNILCIMFICIAQITSLYAFIQDEKVERTAINNEIFVYLSPRMQTACLRLEEIIVDHVWSSTFTNICEDILQGSTSAPYSLIISIIEECLDLITLYVNNTELTEIKSIILEYQQELQQGGLVVTSLAFHEQRVNEIALVYLSPQVQTAFLGLEKNLSDHEWSPAFKSLCQDIYNKGNAVTSESIISVIDECLDSIELYECNDLLNSIKSDIQEYKKELFSGDLDVSPSDIDGNEENTKSCKFKKIRNLCVGLLEVTRGLNVTGPVTISSQSQVRSVPTVLTVNGNETVNGILDVSGLLSVNGTLLVNGAAAADGTVVSVSGGTGINVTGNATSNPTINLTIPVSISDGGTNATSMVNANGVVYYDGTLLNTTSVGTAGQILTSRGPGMSPVFVTGGGGVGITDIDGNTGFVFGSVVTIEGGDNINTIGDNLTTMTINLAGTTDHAVQIGNSTGSLNSVAIGATNTVLLGSTGADPSFGTVPNAALTNSSITLISGTGISVTGSPVSLGGTATINLSTPVLVTNGGTGATTLTGVLIGNGTLAVTGNPVTQFDVLVGGASNAIGSIAPSSTSGVPLISQGSAANPIFGTAVVAGGGTGATTLTTDGVLIGNGTSPITATTAGTNGQVLLGTTAGAPTFVTPTSGSGLSVTANATTLSYAISAPVSIANGGTNATSMTNTYGVVYYDGTKLNTTAVGTSGQLLTSGGTGIAPTFQNFTITGDVGSVSGHSLNLNATDGSGSTVKFSGSGSTMSLNMSNASNTAIGIGAGNVNMGSSNTVLGEGAAGAMNPAANSNSVVGQAALYTLTGGSYNCAFGASALPSLTNGSSNVAIGQLAGSALTGIESGNIYLGANVAGTQGESGVLRIGQGLSAAYIDAIVGTGVSGSPVLVSAIGQLGVAVSSSKYKDNIKDIDPLVSSKILDLRPVTFNYKKSELRNEIHYGLIAEEVEEIIPNLVIYDKNNEPQTVKYHELPVLLLAQIKLLSAEIERLNCKIVALETK